MRYIFSLLVLSVLLMHCSPKTAAVTKDAKEMKEKVETKVVETFRSNSPAPGPAPKIQMGTYESFKLDNGLQVIMVENHKLPRLSLRLFVDVPDIMQKESAGYIEMAGSLLSKGTSTRTKAQLDEEIDFIGATVSSDADGLFAASLTKHTDKLLELMTDVLYNPSFPQAEFDKLKKQTLSGLASSKDDPNTIAGNVASVLRYGKDHPYGELTTEETVENITMDKIRNYYNTYFKPNISYLVVVGDVNPAAMKSKLNSYFGKWKASSNIQRPTYKMPAVPTKTSVDFVSKAGAVQSVINITYPLSLKPGEDDVIPSSVLNTMLGGYFQSRLNDNLRETNAYTYGARSSLRNNRLDGAGSFTASASVRNEVSDSAIVQFMHELNRVRTELAPVEEVEMVKSVIAGQFSRQLESPQTVARYALNTFLYNLPENYYANYLERLSKVTPADVMAMAKKYVKPDNAHIVVVGNKDDVAEKLNRFDPTGKITYYDTYANEIDMSSSINTDNVSVKQIQDAYISAIGGAEKVKAIKNLDQKFETEMQGMKLLNRMVNASPDKMMVSLAVNGNVMQKQILNNDKAVVVAGGQTQPMAGQDLEIMVFTGRMFYELNPSNSNVKSIVKGAEPIEGQQAYKVVTETASGGKILDYYDTNSGLKVRTITQSPQGANTVDFMDYKEVSGVMLPHTMKITAPALPMPLVLKSVSIEANSQIDDSIFEIK